MAIANHQIKVQVDGEEFLVEVGDLNSTPIKAVVDGHTYEVVIAGQTSKQTLVPQSAASKATVKAKVVVQDQPPADAEGILVSPLPGNVVEVMVQSKQQVEKGDPLCVLDAMKMKNVIYSARAGCIASVEISPGQAVDYGTVLIRYE